MGIVSLILAVPILIGLYYGNRFLTQQFGRFSQTSANANQIAFFVTLIAAGIMVAAPITQIGVLTLIAFVLYIAYLVEGLRHVWRWLQAIRHSEQNRSR